AARAAAQYHRTAERGGGSATDLLDRLHRLPVVPRSRPAAAGGRLGTDDQREPHRPVHPTLGRAAAGHRDRAADHRHQPARGLLRPSHRIDFSGGMMSTKTETVRHDAANEPNEKIVLRVTDLRVEPNARGEILGLVGESGSGKTTAGLACMGHFREGLKFGSGSVSIWPRGDATAVEVVELDEVAVRSLRGSRIAYIPQDPALSLNPAMRVGEQIREVLDIHDFGSSERERTDRVAEVLVDVGLPGDKDYQKRWPHQLSGGQQQRIGIAMAFA